MASIVVIPGLLGISVYAAEEKIAKGQKELKFTEKMAAILFQGVDDSFVYKREGRPDPFVPFIKGCANLNRDNFLLWR